MSGRSPCYFCQRSFKGIVFLCPWLHLVHPVQVHGRVIRLSASVMLKLWPFSRALWVMVGWGPSAGRRALLGCWGCSQEMCWHWDICWWSDQTSLEQQIRIGWNQSGLSDCCPSLYSNYLCCLPLLQIPWLTYEIELWGIVERCFTQISFREHTKNCSRTTGENVSCRKGQRKRRIPANRQVKSRQGAAMCHGGLNMAETWYASRALISQ